MFGVIFVLLFTSCLCEDNAIPSPIVHVEVENLPNLKTGRILTDVSKKIYTKKKTESVEKFWKNYNSLNPVALLVDDTEQSKLNAAKFLKNLQEIYPQAEKIDFILLKFNSSGVSTTLETTFNNANRVFKLLEENQIEATSYLNPNEFNGTAAFFAILNAINLLQPNNAIVVFLDRKIIDEELSPHAVLTANKKNIRIYVIWGGNFPTTDNEEVVLKGLSEYSNGLFIINSDRDLSQYYYKKFLEEYGGLDTPLSLILSKENILGQNSLSFVIDSDVTGIHVRVEPNVTLGHIKTPSGLLINILDSGEVTDYSAGSFVKQESGQYEVHFNTTSVTTSDVGLWRLTLKNAGAFYNVTVYVYSKLTAETFLLNQNKTGSKEVLKLSLSEDVKLVNEILFVDKDGQIINQNGSKNVWNKYSIENSNKENKSQEIIVDINQMSRKPFYAQVNGKDVRGYNFSRLSYIYGSDGSKIFPKEELTIDVGQNSELIATANSRPNIYFEVTNYGSQPLYVYFSANGEKHSLAYIRPERALINPKETKTVRLALTTRPASYRDLITFYAQRNGNEVVKKQVYLDVGTSEYTNDRNSPYIDYKYTSDCTNIILKNCQEGTWTIEVNSKDSESGLLQLSSYPKGLYIPKSFISGNNDLVYGYYSDSCCNPDLQIIATDRNNNRNVVNANAYRTIWSAGAIAALVLGIIILILIIILIVYLIRKCIKRRESYNLPVYRGRYT